MTVAGHLFSGLDKVRGLAYKALPLRAQVAQLVEQRTENPRVGGSIPPLGTIPSPRVSAALSKTFGHGYAFGPAR